MSSIVRNMLIGAVLLSAARGQDFQGAEAVLQSLEEAALGKGQATPSRKVADLRERIRTLRTEIPSLPPAEAANRWLTLLNGYLSLSSSEIDREANPQASRPGLAAIVHPESRLSLPEVLSALPPSAVWDEIGTRLARRNPPDALPELLVSVLRGDNAAQNRALNALKQKAADSDANSAENSGEDSPHRTAVQQLQDSLELLSTSESGKVALFEKRLTTQEQPDAPGSPRHSAGTDRNLSWTPDPSDPYRGSTPDIPDLVRLAGEERAAALLTRTLKVGMGSMVIDGAATRKLAVKLAIENIDQLPKPVWSLVETADDAPLYEALVRKFPTGSKEFEIPRRAATAVYLLALLGSGREAEAWAAFSAESGRLRPESSQLSIAAGLAQGGAANGQAREVTAFLKRLLKEQPEAPLWRSFIQLSAQAKESAEALNFMVETLARTDLQPAAAVGMSRQMSSQFALALCAADQRDLGVLVLRELVRAGRPAGRPATGTANASLPVDESVPPPAAAQSYGQAEFALAPEVWNRLKQLIKTAQPTDLEEYVELCSRLAAAGQLQGRPELTAEALDGASSRISKQIPGEDDEANDGTDEVLPLLRKYHRNAEAEKLIARKLVSLSSGDDGFGDSWERRRQGEELVKLYDESNRPADVLLLLEKFPAWGAGDLSAASPDLLLPAAKALAAAGRLDAARRVLRRHLEWDGSNDRGYELLLKIGGDVTQILAQLDSLASLNRFEERPLIWKARLLLDQGKLDEAEKTVRAAITIDPSDGEQGKGDRMRAYAVLAEILEKKGDAETAKIMRGAVSAIRKSEDADDWWSAGFLSEAVRRYEESLNDFADAYCIQSRLALRYSEMGDDAKAEEHYIRAFELMPDSFGRVESHCFGCEGAFTSPKAQNAAERVFTRLLTSPPVKAQVYYLLGYLRVEQNRKPEAATAYRNAVAADPDYLNAWRKLESLGNAGILPAEEAEAVTFKLLELDPKGAPSSRVASVRNFRKLWDAVPAWQHEFAKREKGPLLPLPASAAAFAAKPRDSFSLWLDSSTKETDLSREIWDDSPVIKLVTEYIENQKNQ